MEEIPIFLTKEKLTSVSSAVWDTTGRLEDMEKMYAHLKYQFEVSKGALEESTEVYKMRGKVFPLRTKTRSEHADV